MHEHVRPNQHVNIVMPFAGTDTHKAVELRNKAKVCVQEGELTLK